MALLSCSFIDYTICRGVVISPLEERFYGVYIGESCVPMWY
jgi:hypothetical protein